MRKIFFLLLISAILFDLVGCASLAKKFTRKRKEPVKTLRFYKIKEYKKEPSPELYKKHYTYWMTWQSELISTLGKNHKKDRRCIDEILSNLYDMQNILIRDRAARLKVHIDKLARIKETIDREELTQFNKDSVRDTLEHEDRAIKREFCLPRVKDSLRKSFDDEEQSEK